jgi:hypothetical protein
MPFWCGSWGASGGGWWIFPLLGVAVMAAFAFACLRGFGCMGWRSPRRPDELASLQREVQELKEDVRKLRSAT